MEEIENKKTMDEEIKMRELNWKEVVKIITEVAPEVKSNEIANTLCDKGICVHEWQVRGVKSSINR